MPFKLACRRQYLYKHSEVTNLTKEDNNMAQQRKKKAPEIILREGKPSAVILDIDEYQEMLERLEDLEELKMLQEMRKKPLKFKKLDDFLKEYQPSV
jgi:PHD/YefM family antitoxin component YafN of YafNO toxin-antitoxin module